MREYILKLNMILIVLLLFAFFNNSPARKLIVDKNGLGQYTTVQAGINAAIAGDTLVIFPGVYNEQLNLGKDIVIQGSGYENTRLISDGDPALSMSAGKVMWVSISSNSGVGVGMTGGTLSNCVVWNCPSWGVDAKGPTIYVKNCNIIDNNYSSYMGQVFIDNGTINIINCMIRNTGSSQSNGYPRYGSNGKLNMLYNCLGTASVNGTGTGGFTTDPKFVSSTDFRINSSSPCWDTGKPDIYDPDGSRSDIGYYGGTDAPVFPVVSDMRIYINPDGSVNIQATAISPY